MSDENQQLKPGVVGGMENHIFELRAELEAAKAEVERLKDELQSSEELRMCANSKLGELLFFPHPKELQSELTATRAKLEEADRHMEALVFIMKSVVNNISCVSCGALPCANCQSKIEAIEKALDNVKPSPTIPAALVDKLEGAATGLAREVASIHRGHSDPAFKFPCEIVWESALAELQAFRNGGKV